MQVLPPALSPVRVIFDGFAEIAGWLMSASVRKHRTRLGPGALRLAGLPRFKLPNWGLESCATNSPTMNGSLSNRCCRTSPWRSSGERQTGGIFWVLRSGAPWRDLPTAFGPYTTCYNRFVRWRRAGVWGRIIEALANAHDAAVQMIDTSIVRVHQHGACITRNRRQSMGRSRGGLTSKIHAVVDGNGLPVRLALSPGEAHDVRLAGNWCLV